MLRLAPKTQAGYLRAVRQFTVFLGRSPDTATVEDLRRYQLHLVDRGFASFPPLANLSNDMNIGIILTTRHHQSIGHAKNSKPLRQAFI